MPITVPITVPIPAGPVVRPKATLGAGLLTLSGSLPSQALVDQLSAAAKSLVANVGGGYVLDPRSPYSTGGTIEVTDLLRFDRGGTDSTSESKGLLDSVAFIMTKAPDSSIVVAAYTDNEGDPLRNVGLAANRIDSIVAYLATKGIAPSRVVPAPRGGAEPIADNATEEGRAANRRAKVWINFALGT